MTLDKSKIENIAKAINSDSRKERRLNDYKRYLLYNGKSKKLIEDALKREFTQETVDALLSRVVTLNITKKIINKQAGVYVEPPIRKTSDENTEDNALLNKYEDILGVNVSMKEANRYLKLTKRIMLEVYLDDDGLPRSRALPSHTYEVFSFSKKSPNRVDAVAVIQKDSLDLKEQEIDIWTKDDFVTIDGHGKIISSAEESVNPYGALPFFYRSENSLGVDPIEEDDLAQMAIVIPVVLTDLLFGLKYQTFSLLYTVGVKGDLPLNPNTLIQLDFDADGKEPSINSVKAEFDSDKILRVVFNLVEMLLSVNNLSSPIATGSISAGNAVSGISKILDSAESVENKRDQQDLFLQIENQIWKFIATKGIRAWKMSQGFNTEFNKEFTTAFLPVITFKEPKAMISDKEKAETLKLKKDLKAVRQIDVVREFNPDMDEAGLVKYMAEIKEEDAQKIEPKADPENDPGATDG